MTARDNQPYLMLQDDDDDHASCSESGSNGSVVGGVDMGRYSEHIVAACVAANAKLSQAGQQQHQPLLPNQDEKVRKRRISNLKSVRQSRERKKERVEQYQMEASRLMHANAALKQENEQLENVMKEVEWVIGQRQQQAPQISFVCNAATMNPFHSTTAITKKDSSQNSIPKYSDTLHTLSHNNASDLSDALPHVQNYLRTEEVPPENLLRERSESSSHQQQKQQQQQQPSKTEDVIESFRRNGGGAMSMLPAFHQNNNKYGILASSSAAASTANMPQNNRNNNTTAQCIGESCHGIIHQNPYPMNTFSLLMATSPEWNTTSIIANSFPRPDATAEMLHASSFQLKPSFFAQYQQQQQQQQQQQLFAQQHQQQITQSFLANDDDDQVITPLESDKPRTCLHPAFYFGSSALNAVKIRQQQPMQQQQEFDPITKPMAAAAQTHLTVASTISPAMRSSATALPPPGALANTLAISEGTGPTRNCLHPSFYCCTMTPDAMNLSNVSQDKSTVAKASIPSEISFGHSMAAAAASLKSPPSTSAVVAAAAMVDFSCDNRFYGMVLDSSSQQSRLELLPITATTTSLAKPLAFDDVDALSVTTFCNCEEGSCYSSFDEEVNLVTL